MKKPALVIMAAGMGNRYGGLKQIDPITEQGEIIIDFSLYDAMLAGFEDIVFIIKREIEEDIRALIDGKAGRRLNITYVYQELGDLPPGYSVPEGRVKPWGTCHAVLAARSVIDGNFAVINADDYYGPQAYRLMYEELLFADDTDKYDFSMIGYKLANTLTEYGSVARGVCVIGEDGNLAGIDERLKIMRRDGIIQYEDDEGWHKVPEMATASMNFWGFTPSILSEMEKGLPLFLDKTLKDNPLNGEYLLPREVDELLGEGRAAVKVLHTNDRWFGITYKEDKEHVAASLREKKEKGLYPQTLF